MTELERIGRLERTLDRFTILGAGVNVEGDLHRGYAIGSGVSRIGGISGVTPTDCLFGVTLVCDSISASHSKCGFLATDIGGGYTHAFVDAGSGCACDTTVQYDSPSTGIFLTGTSRYSSCHSDAASVGFVQFSATYNADCSSMETSCEGSITIGGFEVCACTYGACTTDLRFLACGFGCSTEILTYCGDEMTLSDEYTNELLLSNTQDALPAYCGVFGCDDRETCTEDGQGCECLASRDLSEDEISLTIQRFKYKFTFAASPTRCTLRWIERFTPDEGDVVDTPMSEVIEIGQFETSVYEVLEPDEDGEITIVT